MKDALPSGNQNLKRRANRRSPVADPLELFYAGIGYLGVFYESQLVYFKSELDAASVPDAADHLIQSLEAAQAFAVNLMSRNPAGVPLNQSVYELIEANRAAVQQLAVDGKELVQRIQEERKRR